MVSVAGREPDVELPGVELPEESTVITLSGPVAGGGKAASAALPQVSESRLTSTARESMRCLLCGLNTSCPRYDSSACPHPLLWSCPST
jgi:hypothetical protein